jgi:hypothetical protein
MARKLNAPDEIGGSSTFLSGTDAGWFLFTVVDGFEGRRQTKEGFDMFDGISIEAEVVGGTHDGKRYTLNLWDGKLSAKDQGKSAEAKQTAFLIAVDVLSPSDLGKSDLVYEIEKENEKGERESVIAGGFFVMELVAGRPTDSGKVYLEPNYANIFHIDDPRWQTKFKLDKAQASRISPLEKKYRHAPEYFDRLTKKPTAKAESAKDLDFAGL